VAAGKVSRDSKADFEVDRGEQRPLKRSLIRLKNFLIVETLVRREIKGCKEP
jgi:hypothetical protein